MVGTSRPLSQGVQSQGSCWSRAPFQIRQGAEVRNSPLFPGLCDKGDVEFICVEDQGPPGRARVPVRLVEQLEEPGSNVHGDPHDNAFGYP